MSKQQIGVVGMAVMGRNLALNIESRGYSVSIFNRSSSKTDEVVALHPDKKLVPTYTVEEFVQSLKKPKRNLEAQLVEAPCSFSITMKCIL